MKDTLTITIILLNMMTMMMMICDLLQYIPKRYDTHFVKDIYKDIYLFLRILSVGSKVIL
jgi:hypothetical protein